MVNSGWHPMGNPHSVISFSESYRRNSLIELFRKEAHWITTWGGGTWVVVYIYKTISVSSQIKIICPQSEDSQTSGRWGCSPQTRYRYTYRETLLLRKWRDYEIPACSMVSSYVSHWRFVIWEVLDWLEAIATMSRSIGHPRIWERTEWISRHTQELLL